MVAGHRIDVDRRRPMRISVRRVIDAPPESVWAVLEDIEGQAAWMPDVAWIRGIGQPAGLGARFRVRTRVLGVPATTDEIEVTAWEAPHRMAVAHRGFVRGRGEWRLRPSIDGRRTLFEWDEELTMPPPVLGELALRAYGPVQRAMLRRSIRNLGRMLGGDAKFV
jgi:carbon monoxide dehydrogenase subunit G